MSAIDYAWSKPSIAAMQAAGVTGVLRYLAPLPNGKVITRDEYRQLRAGGIDVVLNWEYDARDWLGGASKGAAHAAEAVRQARALGYPAGCGIYGSADFDMSRSQWDSGGRGYATAFRDGIRVGGYREGVYGPWDVLAWCRELGYGLLWQAGMSTAWSGGRNRAAFPGAHLRQRRTATIGGADCDVNDILQPNYGQQSITEDDMAFTDEDHGWLAHVVEVLGAFESGEAQMWTKKRVNAVDQLNALARQVAELAARPPGAFTEDQLAAIGAAAATTGATILGARLEDVEHRLDELITARLAAAHAEAEQLAPPAP